MVEYVVEPKSRKQLRELASILRNHLGLKNEIFFPIVELLDVMCELFPKFSYEIVPDSTFPDNVHADTDVMKHHIRIKESVYEGAAEGNGRDRMTIAHEIGHYFTLCFCGFKFQRNFKKEKIPAYKSPEWQAKCFAGELLVDFDLVRNMQPYEIVEKCGVSYEAAYYQYRQIHKIA
ncbi:MAG: ImmA/IrrE family metallo-endopeptidase [Lachnospiraceae bacterium]|nr:ImmA/IrrE family metallo-endopeptidase [Lachnospiraceae bacterium]